VPAHELNGRIDCREDTNCAFRGCVPRFKFSKALANDRFFFRRQIVYTGAQRLDLAHPVGEFV
jgi:hypothetical protein